jgi:hypothetical protein
MTAPDPLMKPDKNSSGSRMGYPTQPGPDPIEQALMAQGRPVTRESYIKMAGWEEPLDAELAETMPLRLQTES